MLIPATYKDNPDGPKGLLIHIRIPGQRWFRLACFGNKSHYRADGGCEHTDALMEILTDYGRKVTTLEPFGAGKSIPKRYADTPAARKALSLTSQKTTDPPPIEEGD